MNENLHNDESLISKLEVLRKEVKHNLTKDSKLKKYNIRPWNEK